MDWREAEALSGPARGRCVRRYGGGGHADLAHHGAARGPPVVALRRGRRASMVHAITAVQVSDYRAAMEKHSCTRRRCQSAASYTR
jgi:hypothetical protein